MALNEAAASVRSQSYGATESEKNDPMGWLVGLAIVAIAIYFRRGYILLIALAALGTFVWFTNPTEEDDMVRVERREDALRAADRVREERGQPAQIRVWEVIEEVPPAGGRLIPRSARVVSNDNLCTLELDGPADEELARIYCNRLQIAVKRRVEVQFDSLTASDTMAVSDQYAGRTNEIRILGDQPDDGSTLTYAEFLKRMTNSDVVSFKLRPGDDRWVTFTLNGSDTAVAAIYAERP